MSRPNCYNRPDYKPTVTHQDGWANVILPAMGVDPIATRVPQMETRRAVMSMGCRQHGPFGAATIYGWDCSGCRHKPR